MKKYVIVSILLMFIFIIITILTERKEMKGDKSLTSEGLGKVGKSSYEEIQGEQIIGHTQQDKAPGRGKKVKTKK